MVDLVKRNRDDLLRYTLLSIYTVITVLSAYIFFTSFNQQDVERQEIRRANVHIDDLEALKISLLNAETGQRGYLLTKDIAYLEPFQVAISDLDIALDKALAEHHYNDVFPQTNVPGITQLSAEKIAELKETIRLVDTGREASAIALVKSDEGKQLMDQLRILIANEITTEKSRAALAQARLDEAVIKTFLALGVLSVLVGVLLAYAFSTSGRAMRTDEAEAAAVEAEEEASQIRTVAEELDHRLKNVFAVTTGLLRQTARGQSPDVKEYAENFSKRLQSMGVAYSMTHEIGEPRRMDWTDLIDSVVRTQTLPSHVFKGSGKAFEVREKAVTPLALILHELTTNALKYGAWKDTKVPYNDVRDTVNSQSEVAATRTILPFPDPNLESAERGNLVRHPQVALSLDLEDKDELTLVWKETGILKSADIDKATGYGTKLINMCARQLGGDIRREWREDSLLITLVASRDIVVSGA